MYLLITIDTEGDNAWAGKGYENRTENARFLPRFHRLCNRYGFKPTYLTTYEMANDGYFVEFAGDALGRGECEIGAHPHAWNQPPHHPLTSDDTRARPYLIEYPEPVMEHKLRVLTDRLSERFGVPMRSHRAGRWAMNATYARILAALGYTVDCSVTPHASGVLFDRPAPDQVKVPLPDYSQFSDTAYFLDENDISRSGDLPVLEVPMTIVPGYGAALAAIYGRIAVKQVRRAIRGLLGQPVLWFRPARQNRGAMLRVAERKLADGSDYIMFMLHSSELMPGSNPTFKTYGDIEILYDSLDEIFQWLCDRGVEGATLTEYRRHFLESRGRAAPRRAAMK
jgi:hypothetical protein